MDEFRLISQRAFPSKKNVDTYVEMVEGIKDSNLRKVLKLILCSGFRIGEALNSYLYRDEMGRVIVRGVAEKKFRVTRNRMFKRGFLGKPFLNRNLSRSIWKEVVFLNIFNLDVDELMDEVSEDFTTPRWLFEDETYSRLYRTLKNGGTEPLATTYYVSRLERPKDVDFIPSFHFYRKLFSAELNNHVKDAFELLDYMKWESIGVASQYVKTYNSS